jgi:hypothetical protein
MKIEIGESLMLSWLRHAKNCQLVQLNWKPSVNSWQLYNEATLETIMIETQEYYIDKFGLDLFKGNSTCSQLLQQGEIDAVGIEINLSGVESIYGIDIAFHESGLNYGTKDETVARVIKKMIRSAMIIHGYFNLQKANIIFAAPKVHNAVYSLLEQCFDELNKYFQSKELAYSFSLICNEAFRDKIFNVVTALSKSVADTSELFMRSIQMYNMFNQDSSEKYDSLPSNNTTKKQIVTYTNLKGFEEIKIGALVKTSIARLIDSELLDSNELDRLKEFEYCKRIFNINYPFFREYENGTNEREQTMINGYRRYHAKPYQIDRKLYFLCNDWYEDKNRSYFLAWLNKFEKKVAE